VIPGFERSSSTDPALGAPGRVASSPRRYAVLQLLKLALAALLAYAIWRSYQNPDLLLDLSSWRLC